MKTETVLRWMLGPLCFWQIYSCAGPVPSGPDEQNLEATNTTQIPWTGPPSSQIPYDTHPEGPLIYYGYQLISNTAYYLGPKGKVARQSNGMNCQNCHLEGGTKPFGNNYGAVASTYPKYRDRSGTVETIEKRVNDCFERSLNGRPLADTSLEMRAIKAYLTWLGRKVPRGEKPYGAGIMELPYMSRAAHVQQGESVYKRHCVRCHGPEGQGELSDAGNGYLYPPLWGPNSYNDGAGLYRISRLAGYVYNNMPNTVNWHKPELTVEEAWDVAAFINSQPRPKKDIKGDWPDISTKPIDHPFGPFADTFPEIQHKLGPFAPIAAWKKKTASQSNIH